MSIGSSSAPIICGLAHALVGPGHSVPWSAFAADYDRIRNAIHVLSATPSAVYIVGRSHSQTGRPVWGPMPERTTLRGSAVAHNWRHSLFAGSAPSVTPVTDGAACHLGNGTAIRHARYRRRISALTKC